MKTVYKRVAVLSALFIIISFISAWLIVRTYFDLNTDLIRKTSLALAQSVEQTLENASYRGMQDISKKEKKRLQNLMRSMATEDGSIIHILLIDTTYQIIISSDKKIEGYVYKSPQELENFQDTIPKIIDKTWEGGIDVVDIIIPLKDTQKNIFSYLRLVLSQKELSELYADLSKIFIPITIVFFFLIVLTLYFLSRIYRKPLDSIKKMANRLEKGDYSYRINYSRQDEFTDAFKRINSTIEKVDVLNESYKKAEKRISSLLEATEDGVVLINSEGVISSYNAVASKLLGQPEGSDFSDFFMTIRERNPEFSELLHQILNEGYEARQKNIVVFPDDSEELHLRLSSQIFRDNDRITLALLSFSNLKAMNEIQRNLQRSMKFSVIANLASSISHEIKNPLSAMAIHAEILNTRIRRINFDDEAKVFKSLDVLQNEVKRLNRIINQFLNLAKMKRTDLSLIQLNSVIKDVLFLIQQQAIERNIKLHSELDPTLDYIYGEPDQLKQVILNIVLNAFHAIGEKGQVFIRTRMSGNRILAEIQDNGKGMPPEVQERVFDLYFSTKSDGGGIGLAISKNIMEVHEGRISFESIPNKGTVFLLDFPQKDKTTRTNLRLVN